MKRSVSKEVNDMKKHTASLMALGAIVALLAGSASLSAQASEAAPRTLSMSGSAKVSVDIDYVELSFAAVTRDKGFEKAQTDNIKIVDRIIKELGNTFKLKPEDVYTDDYTLNEYYQDQPDRNGERIRAGYESRTQLRIKLRDIAKYKDILIGLLKLGVNTINSVNYVPKELGVYKQKALALAFQAARAKADELAKTAGVSIKRVLTLNEQSAVYDAQPRYRGVQAQTNAAYFSESGSSGDGISVGDRTLSAEVYVVFEIQ